MADNIITVLDENGGTIKDRLTFQKADNGYGTIHKNHNSTVDYGTQIRDIDAKSNIATLQILGNLQQLRLVLQKNGENAKPYIIYHEGYKPTPAAIGAAPAYTYGTTTLESGKDTLATGTLYLVYE